MRIVATLLLLAGMLLIASGRYLVRRARRRIARGGGESGRGARFIPRLTGWSLTFLGFIAILLGVTLW